MSASTTPMEMYFPLVRTETALGAEDEVEHGGEGEQDEEGGHGSVCHGERRRRQ